MQRPTSTCKGADIIHEPQERRSKHNAALAHTHTVSGGRKWEITRKGGCVGQGPSSVPRGVKREQAAGPTQQSCSGTFTKSPGADLRPRTGTVTAATLLTTARMPAPEAPTQGGASVWHAAPQTGRAQATRQQTESRYTVWVPRGFKSDGYFHCSLLSAQQH